MRSGTIAFTLGVLACQQLRELPDSAFLHLLPVALLVAALCRRARLPLLVASGFAWAALHAHVTLIDRLPARLDGQSLTLDLTVATVPRSFARGLRFEADAIPHASTADWTRPKRLRLAWYEAPPTLVPGQAWRATVKLRQPRGRLNPHTFDFERWLYLGGVDGLGYLRHRPPPRRIPQADAWFDFDRTRGAIGAGIDRVLAPRRFRGIVKALALGLRDDIPDAQWALLRATGTTHLMAISGLHIGLVAGLGFLLGSRLWLLAGASGRVAAPRAGAIGALPLAAGYAALAGFSLPTQRALTMIAVTALCLLAARRVPASAGLCAALLAVLVLDPRAALSSGLWLSFGAVSVLLYGLAGRLRAGGWWWRWGRAQWLVAIGLLPLGVLYFDAHPLVGPAANAVAVPWVGFVTVPLALLGSTLLDLLPGVATLCLSLAEHSLGLLWPYLELLDQPRSVLRASAAPGRSALALAGLSVLVLLAPRGFPGRWLGVLLALPLLLGRPAPEPWGSVTITVLDVGQGLAAVVRTRGHLLVYDTGPRYGTGFDAGASVLVPYIRGSGRAAVDTLLVSHGDLDHAGGLSSLRRRLALRVVRTNVLTGATDAAPCRAGSSWDWDGVRFEVLHPVDPQAWAGNDGSCVLQVHGAHGRALLTGDIERAAEQALVDRLGDGLRSEVLVVAHHGSDTSSTRAFLSAVSPALALIPVGHGNRYRLPAGAVVDRLRESGARVLRTDRSGAITVRLGAEADIEVREHRRDARRYWHSPVGP